MLNALESDFIQATTGTMCGILVPSLKTAPIIVDAILDMKITLHLDDGKEFDATPVWTGVYKHRLRGGQVDVVLCQDETVLRGRTVTTMLVPERHSAFTRSFIKRIETFHRYKLLYPRIVEYPFPEIV